MFWICKCCTADPDPGSASAFIQIRIQKRIWSKNRSEQKNVKRFLPPGSGSRNNKKQETARGAEVGCLQTTITDSGGVSFLSVKGPIRRS